MMKSLLKKCKCCGKEIYSYIKDDLCKTCGYKTRGYRQCECCKQPLLAHEERICSYCYNEGRVN